MADCDLFPETCNPSFLVSLTTQLTYVQCPRIFQDKTDFRQPERSDSSPVLLVCQTRALYIWTERVTAGEDF